MPSSSLTAFRAARVRAERLLSVSTDRRLRPLTYGDSEPALHAALAAAVSSWEAYVESIVVEAIDSLGIGASADVRSVLLLLKAEAERSVEKFNTPNAENCRDLVLRFTGFDAFPVMRSPRLKLASNLARLRLNEVLKVRHAFAHGFPIPSYGWTTRYGVANRLTKRAVTDSILLIDDFAQGLDVSLAAHLKLAFSGRAIW